MKSQRFGISILPSGKAEHIAAEPPDEGKRQQTRGEQLAFIIPEEEPNSDGEECELHVYERKTDTRGESIYLKAGTKMKIDPPKARSHRACLVLTRYYTSQGELSATYLQIQSQLIIRALREVISSYPGIDLDSKFVTIEEPPRCLFHYQDELRQYAEVSNNSQLKAHMQLCLQYMEKSLHREINVTKLNVSNTSLPYQVEHRHLWTLFKPGCLVYEIFGVIERLSRLRSIYETEDEEDGNSTWCLSMQLINYSGSQVGSVDREIEIKQYEGYKPICELSAVPLHLHHEEERIRRDLLQRGRRFLSLGGISHCFYDGVADMCDILSPNYNHTTHTSVRSRIMLDPEQYRRIVAWSSQPFVLGSKIYTSGKEASTSLSDEDIMTCYHLLPGYSLEFKRWGLFLLADVKEITFNEKAFEALLLPEKNKKLISSLLKQESDQGNDNFDDFIQGKGKGLIVLLHGPPGVGKTYTAESIADHTRRPLLKISSGELHGPGSWVENRLSELSSLSTRWNAVLLLDEADVFMQTRTLYDLGRNQLVSSLLRVLEYYEGILFLTTNRVGTIDFAFKSRIHLAIAYPPLSADARRELWSSSIVRANRDRSPDWLTPDFLNNLANEIVNGREIKNIVRTGFLFARNTKRDMEAADLLQSLDALKEFESDFAKWSEKREGGATMDQKF